ncbi:MAG: sulfatase [Gemmatimonadota bacterium]
MPSRLRERGALIRFAGMAGLLWFAASAAAIGLHLAAPGSAWHDDTLPVMARLSMIGFEIFLLAYPSLIATIAVFALLGRPDRANPAGRVGWVRRATAVLVVALPAVAYGASWALFRSAGQFLGQSTLLLWWGSPLQIAQHTAQLEPLTPVFVTLGAFAFAVAVVEGLRAARSRLRGRAAYAITMAAVLMIPASLMLPSLIGWDSVDGFVRARRATATGPLLRLAADFQSRSAANADPIFKAVIPVTDVAPLITLEEYATGIPAAALSDSALRSNVLIVVVESLRPDQLVAFGGARSAMPTVDGLASTGVRFLRHYTQASHSDYADPTILSSHFPLRSATYHIYPESPPYPRVLIYDILAALGHRAAIFSSQNEGWGGMKYFLDTGSLDRFLHSETYEGETYVPDRDGGFASWASGSKKSGKIDDRFTVGEAIDWIGESDVPFVAYVNLQNSHVPYVVPADFDAPFGSGKVSFPIRFGSFPPDSVDAVKDLYASSLAYVDSQIARLVEFLDESGRLENTIVIVTADTGQAFYEHGFTSHGSALYDEVMHVPLVVVAPGLEPSDYTLPSQHVDIPPTVLGLLGLPAHPGFQGDDLFGPAADDPDRPLFLVGQALKNQYGIVRGDWKLIFDAFTGTYELYDVIEDPGELNDLSTLRPDVMDDLALLLHAWRKAQLSYYDSPAAFEVSYPPRVTGATLTSPGDADPD